MAQIQIDLADAARSFWGGGCFWHVLLEETLYSERFGVGRAKDYLFDDMAPCASSTNDEARFLASFPSEISVFGVSENDSAWDDYRFSANPGRYWGHILNHVSYLLAASVKSGKMTLEAAEEILQFAEKSAAGMPLASLVVTCECCKKHPIRPWRHEGNRYRTYVCQACDLFGTRLELAAEKERDRIHSKYPRCYLCQGILRKVKIIRRLRIPRGGGKFELRYFPTIAKKVHPYEIYVGGRRKGTRGICGICYRKHRELKSLQKFTDQVAKEISAIKRDLKKGKLKHETIVA